MKEHVAEMLVCCSVSIGPSTGAGGESRSRVCIGDDVSNAPVGPHCGAWQGAHVCRNAAWWGLETSGVVVYPSSVHQA